MTIPGGWQCSLVWNGDTGGYLKGLQPSQVSSVHIFVHLNWVESDCVQVGYGWSLLYPMSCSLQQLLILMCCRCQRSPVAVLQQNLHLPMVDCRGQRSMKAQQPPGNSLKSTRIGQTCRIIEAVIKTIKKGVFCNSFASTKFRFCQKHNIRSRKLFCTTIMQKDPEGSILPSKLMTSWALLDVRWGPKGVLGKEAMVNPSHEKEFYKVLCLKLQRTFAVFQRNASLVNHGTGVGLASTTSRLRLGMENHPLCTIMGLGLP